MKISPYQPPYIPLPSSYRESFSTWKIATPQEHLDKGNWWLIFNDPILDNLEQQLNQANQTLAAAVAQYQHSQALLKLSQTNDYPIINLQNSITQKKAPVKSLNTQSSTKGNYQIAMDVGWMPDLWGQVQQKVVAAHLDAQSSAALLVNTRLMLQCTLAFTYFTLRGLDNIKSTLEESIAAYQKLLLITKNRYEAGVDARTNVLQAQSQLLLAQAQALENRILRNQYEHAIASLIGKAPADFNLLPDKFPSALPSLPQQHPSTLLERRPDIGQYERKVAQANAQIGIAKLAYFPSITLTANSETNRAILSHLVSHSTQFWALGGQMATLLFDGGRRQAQIETAQASHQKTVAEYRQVVLSAFQEVEDNLSTLALLHEKMQIQQTTVSSAEKALSLAMNSYKSGTSSFADVLTAEIMLFNAKKEMNEVNYRQYVSTVRLIGSLGGRW